MDSRIPFTGASATVTRNLLERYLAGDQDSERALFNRHHSQLLQRAGAHPLMTRLRRSCAEQDVVDEVFLRALASGVLSRFEDRGRGSLLAMLSTILDRTMVDLVRRTTASKRNANVSSLDCDSLTEEGTSMAEGLQGHDPTPTGQARANELFELCRSLLEEREWQAWELVEHLDHTSTEAAERLGTTPAAIRGLLLRARKKLVQALDSLPPDGPSI